MKKAVLILAALLLVSSFVFADDAGVKIGAWGRGIFVPVMGGDVITSDATISWGGVPRVGFTISGTSANVGFQADLTADNGGVGVGDQQKIWVKPFDMVTVQVGRIFDDTLRGGAGAAGAWNWLRYAGQTADDDVFARVGAYVGNGGHQKNFEIAVAPIEGLYAFVGLGGNVLDNFGTSLLGTTTITAGDMVAAGQYGAGYTIAGIGTIRAQYNGISKDFTQLNAAFKLTAVDKLTVDVGGSAILSLTDAGKTLIDITGNQPQFAIGVTYGLDALTLNAMANVLLPKTGDPSLEFGVTGDYALSDGYTVTGDVHYQNKIQVKGTKDQISGMLAIAKGFSNGLLGLGLELTTGNFSAGVIKTNDNVAWAVPVRFEYFF